MCRWAEAGDPELINGQCGDCNAEKGGKGGLETVEELEGEEQELEEIEMLLETYFMQLDQLFDRLQDMKENIEATAVRTNSSFPPVQLLCCYFRHMAHPNLCAHANVCGFLFWEGYWVLAPWRVSRQKTV